MNPMESLPRWIYAVLIIAVMAVGCSSVEQVTEVDDLNYKTIYSISKKTGVKEGEFSKYDPAGHLYETANYVNDHLHGERKLMHANGNVEILENYEKGKYQGETKIYYEDGTIKTYGQYKDNVAEGIWKSYYPNGQTKEEVTYVDNQEEGPFKEWHENGNIKAEGSYKAGDNEHGELKLYDNNGQLERKMECAMGACSTTWKSDKTTDET